MSVSNVALSILIISPLMYSFDNDPYRSYEVVAVAVICFVFLLANHMRGIRFWPDIFFISIYGLILVTQQLFIVNGSVVFGMQYAIVMASMFIPVWLVRGLPLSGTSFAKVADFSLDILWLITVLMIYASFFFGVGEVYDEGVPRRAFGWLGDSYIPIIVFLILYFSHQGNWFRSGALFGALIITGGKMGLIMLIATVVVYSLFSSISITKKFGIIFLLVCCGLLTYGYWDTLSAVLLYNIDYSYYNRAISLKIGILYFTDNPWSGVGINQSMALVINDAEYFINSAGVNSYPIYQIHNPFVRTATETGIFGLGVMIILCSTLLARSFNIMLRAYHWRGSKARSLALSGALWTVCFILFYQSTGWFAAGHPQLAWLLMISALAEVAYRRTKGAQVSNHSQLENRRAEGLLQ